MNVETGEIVSQKLLEELSQLEQSKYVNIEEELITLKQKERMQVSKFDSKSALGKLRVQHRNSMRNQPCPCGSGIKFKKCCWSKTCS